MFRLRKLLEQFSFKQSATTSTITQRNLTNDANSMVVRKEIRSMSESEQERFFNAIDTMLKTKANQPGTSEFFRCASYHGLPFPIYCQHGRETFPGWHRIYLKDFEQALQSADIQNGNDGQIGLAYWDWTNNINDGLPNIIRHRFDSWPPDLFPDEVKTDYPEQTRELRRASDEQITEQIISFQVVEQARDCLLATQHWLHASTEFNGPYPSIETPHNSIHVIVGGPGGAMSSVAWYAWIHSSFYNLHFLQKMIIDANHSTHCFYTGQRMISCFGCIIAMWIGYMRHI